MVPGGRRTHSASGAIGRNRCFLGASTSMSADPQSPNQPWRLPVTVHWPAMFFCFLNGFVWNSSAIARSKCNPNGLGQRWRREHRRCLKFRQCEFAALRHFVKMTSRTDDSETSALGFHGFPSCRKAAFALNIRPLSPVSTRTGNFGRTDFFCTGRFERHLSQRRGVAEFAKKKCTDGGCSSFDLELVRRSLPDQNPSSWRTFASSRLCERRLLRPDIDSNGTTDWRRKCLIHRSIAARRGESLSSSPARWATSCRPCRCFPRCGNGFLGAHRVVGSSGSGTTADGAS